MITVPVESPDGTSEIMSSPTSISSSAERHIDVLIVGAGPTGLGSACRLLDHGHRNFLVVERDCVGGLASSHRDAQGFIWDLGVHVCFSSYDYYMKTLDSAINSEWRTMQRSAWAYMRNRWVAYPVQTAGLSDLPEEEQARCRETLPAVGALDIPAKDFDDWILQTMGSGLADSFFRPYNRKVWGYPLSLLSAVWVRHRVATPTAGSAAGSDKPAAWGPNATFKYPNRGGVGSMWARVASRIPSACLQLGCSVLALRAKDKTALLSTGETVRYNALVSSMPIDKLIGLCEDLPDLQPFVPQFVHSACHIVGVGVSGQLPPCLQGRSWVYFSEPHVPFYRLTVFSDFGEDHVPLPGQQWSVLCECVETAHVPAPGEGGSGQPHAVVQAVLQGLRGVNILQDGAEICSTFHRRLEYGYPTPWLGRDAVLREVESVLHPLRVYSRGRFGAWRYEVSNQDHSFMQGVEAVDNIMSGSRETVFRGEGI